MLQRRNLLLLAASAAGRRPVLLARPRRAGTHDQRVQDVVVIYEENDSFR